MQAGGDEKDQPCVPYVGSKRCEGYVPRMVRLN